MQNTNTPGQQEAFKEDMEKLAVVLDTINSLHCMDEDNSDLDLEVFVDFRVKALALLKAAEKLSKWFKYQLALDKEECIANEILDELKKLKEKHPEWTLITQLETGRLYKGGNHIIGAGLLVRMPSEQVIKEGD